VTDRNSLERVRNTASKLGLSIDILEMPKSTRTAVEAALACSCEPSQIIKSLVFEIQSNGELILFLISGSNKIDLSNTSKFLGEVVQKAAPHQVRQKTGFAIGGVAPIGHLSELPTYIDPKLLEFKTVWAAAGAPNAVFSIDPAILSQISQAVQLPNHCLSKSGP
tara:strand:- start:825 stop:1319 length:495 start_codon:yes stop_codon:yes gene_type:complete